jgi:hypothetical protein
MLLIRVNLKLINLYLLVLFVIHYQYPLYYQLFHHFHLILINEVDCTKGVEDAISTKQDHARMHASIQFSIKLFVCLSVWVRPP